MGSDNSGSGSQSGKTSGRGKSDPFGGAYGGGPGIGHGLGAEAARASNRAALGRGTNITNSPGYRGDAAQGLAGSWGATGYDPATQGISATTGPTQGPPTLGESVQQHVAGVTSNIQSMRAAGLGMTSRELGDLEQSLSELSNWGRTSRKIAQDLGPGEAVRIDGKIAFEPERGILGNVRDFFTREERAVSPALAATAKTKGVLGDLMGGIRAGVVQTEDYGRKAKVDTLGQVLSGVNVVSSLFGLPSPQSLKSPLGLATGVPNVLGLASGISDIVQEQEQIDALRGAGIVPGKTTQQRAVASTRTAVPGAPAVSTSGATLGVSTRGNTTPVTTQVAAKATGVDDDVLSRIAKRGFASTRRTGAYGITGSLAVRV